MAQRPKELGKDGLGPIGERIRIIQNLSLCSTAKEFAELIDVDEVTISRWKKGNSLSPNVPTYIAKKTTGLGSLSTDWRRIREYILDGDELPLSSTDTDSTNPGSLIAA